ncbi:MAG TPA: zinc ribbon domain-containing protein [Chloroflexota bacterium]|nr:zinc ribbon domain-containing protein [Chloroflexota bacterium]
MLQNIANILQILVAAGVAYFVGFTFALVIWTFRDIQSRSQDVVVQILATLWVAVMNLPGLLIYLILRPSNTLVEAYERSLEEESLLQDIESRLACPNCQQRVQPDFLVCPNCLTQLKKPCANCARVLLLKWAVCPFCAHESAPVTVAGAAPERQLRAEDEDTVAAPTRSRFARPATVVRERRVDQPALPEREPEPALDSR